MGQKSVLVFAGSARKDSFNKILAQYGAKQLADKGIEHSFADLNDYQAPLYHGDHESETGIPDSMKRFKQLMKSHDAFLIASPEYNGFVPPLLINTFSWCSRPESGDTNLMATRGKYIGLMSTSPGPMGGIRMLPRLREALSDLGAVTVPGPVAIGSSMAAFDEDGNLIDEGNQKRVSALIDTLIAIAGI
ncbi:MAG: NAD(P)H-dependent oxidoreductase [Parasphingorhabdus sp.]